jgi:hypothetical protein
MKRLLLTQALLLILLSCVAQNDSTKFCNPQLEGMARSKGFNISYERVFHSKITSTSSDTAVGNSTADINTNNKFDVFLRLPVWNRPGLKVILGAHYHLEEFNFKNSGLLKYDLYKNLHDKNLKSLGANMNILKPLNPISYIGVRMLAEFNGDYSSKEFPKTSFLRYSIAAIYGKKPCPTRTWGLGFYYNYTFGRRSIYPVLLYANTFNKKWGIEALLPANFKVRRNLSEKTLLYFGYEAEGGAYHLQFTNPPLGTINNLELRKSNVRLGVDFEREIYDFLWFGISGGLRTPIGFNLARHNERTPVIRNKFSPSPFIEFNIFIVPPRTLENKIINAR